jgi:hypothetical protein
MIMMKINPSPSRVERVGKVRPAQYHYERKVNLLTSTEGNGYWSRVVKDSVKIIKLDLNHYEDNFEDFELRAYFSKKTWNVEKHGLIYTDKLWLTTFKKSLSDLGFSKNSVKSIDYSEQGMQGDDYVSMDVDRILCRTSNWKQVHETIVGDFIKEYEKVLYSVKERFLGSLRKK